MSADDAPTDPAMPWTAAILRAWCLSVMAFAWCMIWRSPCTVPLIAVIPAGFLWIEGRVFGDDGPRRTFYLIALAAVVVLLMFSVLGPISERLFDSIRYDAVFFQF